MLSASCFELNTHDYQFTLYVNRLTCDHLENWVKKTNAFFYFIKKHIFKLDFKVPWLVRIEKFEKNIFYFIRIA